MSEPAAHFSDLIGKPFAPGGRGPDAYDCWGAWMELRRRLGLAVVYPEDLLCRASVAPIEDRTLENIPGFALTSDPHPGDGILFRAVPGKRRHVGAVVDRNLFLQACDDPAGHALGIHLGRISLFRGHIEGFYQYVG